jgi:hypothetical protein
VQNGLSLNLNTSSSLLFPFGLGLAILDGPLSILSEPLQEAVGVFLGLWSLWLGISGHSIKPFVRRILPAIFTLALAGLCLAASEPSIRPLAPILFWIAGLFLRDSLIHSIEEPILAATLVTAAINIVLSLVPPIWTVLHHVLVLASAWFTKVLGTSIQIGPSAFPVTSMFLVVASVLSTHAPSGLMSWQRLLHLGLLSFGVMVAECLFLSVLARNSSVQVDTGWAFTAATNLFWTLGVLGYGSMLLKVQPIFNEQVPRHHRGVIVLVGFLAGLFILTAPWHTPSTTPSSKVLVLSPPAELDPLLAYRAIPSEPQPLHELSMFGEWARLLGQLGYSVETHVGVPSAEDLAGVRLVCLFAPSATWASDPRGIRALHSFVKRGGSLLVFAEHTNYQTNALILNHVLKPFGIYINFDTTNGGVGEDRRGVRFWQSQFRQALRITAAFPFNRGASLTLSGTARPVLVGRMWQGDVGNFYADDKGFLGDYRLGPGDRWADVVLAGEWHGAEGGRVLVFGDTTPIMNAALGYSGPAIAPILNILMTPAPALAWSWASAVVVLFLVVFLWLEKQRPSFILQAVIIAVAGLAVLVGSVESRQFVIPLPDNAQPFVVATDMVNQFDLSVYGDRSPTAVMIEATRAGLVPLAMRLNSLPFEKQKVVLLLAPRRTLSTLELSTFQDWVERGATVIIAADGSVAPARALLGQLGITVEHIPLGNIMLDDHSGPPVQLQSAWPLHLSGEWRPLRDYHGSIVMAERRLGRGRFIVISDEAIAMNAGVATERTVSPTNSAWWRELLSEASSGS